jgi:uncharacterized membrane-anchored protein YhcB (DUF1043 family)
MSPQLQIALLAAVSAVVGTLMGGLISYLTNKNLNRHKWELEQTERLAASREQLYGEFLAESGRLLLSAIDQKAADVAGFSVHFSLLARVRLVASPGVIKAAEKLAKDVADAHAKEPKEEDESKAAPPYQSFIDAARHELEELRRKT